MDLRPLVLVFWGGGRGRCGWLSDDLNLTALNNHPLDGVAHQCARLGAPPSRAAVGRELGSGQLPAQDLDYQPLNIVSIDTGERACSGSAVMQQRAADVVAIAVAPANRIGWGHDVAAVIIDQASEEGPGFDRRLPSYRAIVLQPGLDRAP